jgi:pilus assembly protein CpaC
MLAVLVALLLQGPVSQPCPATDVIRLGMGTQKLLAVSSPSALRSSNPGIVDLKQISPNQLLLIGASQGTTTLSFEQDGGVRSYRVQVEKLEGCGLGIVELANAFPCGSTLQLRMLGDRIYLDGEASSFEEWRAAFTVVDKYPSVVVLGRIKPEVVDREFVEAEAALRGVGLSRVHWVRAGNSVLLEGELPEEDRPRLRAVEAEWRPRLELLLSRPRVTAPPKP